MLKFKWSFKHIKTPTDIDLLVTHFNIKKPKYGAFDTETTGLHIIKDKPFLLQFGYIDESNMLGWVYTVDLRTTIGQQTVEKWHTLAPSLKYYAGHNVKFDLHMLKNLEFNYDSNNITDTMFWIRYGHDALHTGEGGPPLGLKDYAARYIDPAAKVHEQLLKSERSAKAKEYNTRLRQRTKLSMKDLNKYMSDCIFEPEDLPDYLRTSYHDWLTGDLPLYLQKKVTTKVEADMIRYDTLNEENLIKYAGLDIVYTLEILWSLIPKVKARDNMWAIELENKLIYPLVDMERVGFKVNRKYLEESRVKLKNYIIERRQDLYRLANDNLQIGQHAKIKQIIKDKFGVTLASTGNEALERVLNTTDNQELKEFIEIITELRTLEKWYSVYILRFERDLSGGQQRLYTTINQVGAVSGRVTSDFQQFPRGGITTKDGEELFQPRKMIYTDTAIVYLDYSQIELRFQAFYTILVGHPDTNLCRAYMPYDCHTKEGEQFDFTNSTHIKDYYKIDWYHNEDEQKWEPVDVHGATTTAATGLQPTDEGFKKARYDIGKRVNFAKNYGASLNRIRQMFPDKTEEEVKRIDAAYYTAFPGVKKYHEYCDGRAREFSNTANLFGVKYYNVSGHKLKNMLIQGSAAFYLKTKIVELYEYCKENHIKTKWQMQIHDELSWEVHPQDDPKIFFEFKRIMEDWPDAQIPIIADMEVTNKTWADKIEVETIEKLKGVLYGK